MKSMIQKTMAFGIVPLLAAAAMLATVARADCYRYLSGSSWQELQIDESCVQSQNIPRIFVEQSEDGYNLIIPTPSEDNTSLSSRRAAAAIDWLSSGSNLADTEATIYTMLNDGAWLRGVPVVEQMNYSLATWLNTTGATTSIASLAADTPSPQWPETSCPQICGFCRLYWYALYRYRCSMSGSSCCVIGIAPPPWLDVP